MNINEIVKRAILAQCYSFGLCYKDIAFGLRLKEDLLLDSLDLTEIALMIEKDIGIKGDLKIILTDKALFGCETVGHLCNLVRNHLPKGITCE